MLSAALKGPSSWVPVLRVYWRGKNAGAREPESLKVIPAKDGEWVNKAVGGMLGWVRMKLESVWDVQAHSCLEWVLSRQDSLTINPSYSGIFL